MNATLRTHSSASAAISVERILRAAYEKAADFVAAYRTAAKAEMNAQRAIRDLYSMSDRELRDIGITRGEIEQSVRGLAQ